MMLLTTLILIFTALAQTFLPWWSCVIVAFSLSAFLSKSAGKAFLSGFFGIFLLWIGFALLIHVRNEFILADRIATMLTLPTSHLLPIISGFVGGMAGGIASWAGKFSGDLLRNL